MAELITSVQNPKIKKVLLLQKKSAERRKDGLFVVEGKREVLHCINAGMEIFSLFYCRAILGETTVTTLLNNTAIQHRCFEISKEIYEKIALRGSTEGIVAEVKMQERHLSSLQLGNNPLLMVVESVEKPGNLGAILRSADAAHADAVIVCDPLTDLYNPNLIRSSLGAFFTVPCVTCTSDECIAYLKQKGIRILTAQLQDSQLYYNTDMRLSTAIVMGTESTGLTEKWRQAADAHIRIPMLGNLDSLNVSVSAAILLFEVVRQRNC